MQNAIIVTKNNESKVFGIYADEAEALVEANIINRVSMAYSFGVSAQVIPFAAAEPATQTSKKTVDEALREKRREWSKRQRERAKAKRAAAATNQPEPQPQPEAVVEAIKPEGEKQAPPVTKPKAEKKIFVMKPSHGENKLD